MSGGNAIRGTKIGAGPIGEAARGESAPRTTVSYWCSRGHESLLSFAADAEVPETWDCQRCGVPAGKNRHAPPEATRNEPYKSHLAYVKERRSEEDGKAILDEALAKIRSKRDGTV